MTAGGAEGLAEAIRELVDRVAAVEAPEAALAEAAGAVRAATERLRAAGRPRTLALAPERSGDQAWMYLRRSPVSGALNPLAPPVRFEVLPGGEVEGTVSFGVAYQGPPGCVHGGWVAAVFDDLLGAANTVSGNPGMTVRLEVSYLRPTPLDTPLRVVGRHVGREGRRIFAKGAMLAGGEVTAEADGVFAEITPARARRLFGGVIEGRRSSPPPRPSPARGEGERGGGDDEAL
jgi:acyl-coenzyme A thioesterase PaaI-like protein